ncbi:hypothetical protein PAXRUDRAFT_9040 [Paxillus rubicundulus Ve08.2h10]|uniref:DUF7729 domain-containing protein n=1 Tax=Paxillus rubicundulus Ve08.2h10 TaxID=930991 RepID=A0A0D0E958_9AGAM|nr:hypothetical protein PAXRUDRAFT_9040 [Paxillus rubicundulus Ve08.2h10]
MFTPPPSPLPPRPVLPPEAVPDDSNDTQTVPSASKDTLFLHSKHKVHRSLRWTVILVPLVLILIAGTTRFLTHPVAFDLFVPGVHHDWTTWTEKLADRSTHARHGTPNSLSLKKPTSISFVPRGTPTVPTVPITPVLSTPFPQPFDTTLSTNFSTNSCYDFFINMLESDSFRSCRSFSLLITKSNAFQEAQKDIDAMNADVWGTCNTNIPQDQCDANMVSFASSLQSSCRTDLADQVEMAVSTLTALQAYDLMRNAACQVDTTNSYCYVDAVANSDPSSYWFYQLPLGQPLASITNNACNECTKRLMAIYAAALDSTNGTNLDGLAETYSNAADSLNSVCGSSYAQAAAVSTSSAFTSASMTSSETLVAVLIFTTVLVLCGT